MEAWLARPERGGPSDAFQPTPSEAPVLRAHAARAQEGPSSGCTLTVARLTARARETARRRKRVDKQVRTV